MKIVLLKDHPEFIVSYVELRNTFHAALLTDVTTLERTTAWLATANLDLNVLIEKRVVLGAVILYPDKQNEVSVVVRTSGKGYGTKLLLSIEETARKRKTRTLRAWIDLKNKKSQQLFEHFGYVPEKKATKQFEQKQYHGSWYIKSL